MAKENLRPMLKQGKTWWYVYHHFEEKENLTGNESYREMYNETRWEVSYTLNGDTTIQGRQYIKMYREDPRGSRYYGAFREDEEGRVWQYDYEGDQKDFMLADITFTSYPYPGQEMKPTADVIKVGGQLLHRYEWKGFVGVEGVGFKEKGLVHYLFAPEPDCICDYESFVWVYDNGLPFSAGNFSLPKYIELTDAERQLVESNNDFAFRLFSEARSVKDSDTNLILSPLSITYALGLLNNGAAGQTQEEINTVLGFKDAGADGINAFCRKMLSEADGLDKQTKARISNTIFVNEGMGYRLQEPFVKAANDFYDAQPEARNFADGKTLDVINQWASDHTEGMIKKVLSEDEFSPAFVSYLLNAIYFKGMWSQPFQKENTREEPFSGGASVPMMHQEHSELVYADNDLYQAIQLPYGNGAYLMTVLLPHEDKTISDVLAVLNGKQWQVKGGEYEVDLKLPRFETSSDIELIPVMEALGMSRAFDPMLAEFPYFCNVEICIGLMKQVAKIKLDEEGTEAAAVTVIGEKATGMPKEIAFHACRPFLYIISEQSTGIIFFIGQYTGEEEAVAIQSPSARHLPTPSLFNLEGQRLSSPPAKGLYIRGGKKFSR
jgi:serpin B